MKRIWMMACGLLLIFGLGGNQPVQAQSEEISATVSYTFGQQVNFEILLPDPHEVDSLTLYLTAPATNQYISIDLSSEFLAENPVRYSAAVTELELVPFAELTFVTELRQADGTVVTLPEQKLVYEDDRLRWRRLEREETIVYWTEGETEVATTALSVLDNNLPTLRERVPGTLPNPLRIYLYPSAADLRSALRLNGLEWTAGAALPELGVILLTVPNPRTAEADLQRTLPHEMSHLLLYDLLQNDYPAVPVWFDEGLATLAEGIANPNQVLLLERALEEETTFSLSALCLAFPEDEGGAVLAYAQSASLLRLIEMEFGRSAIQRLIQAFSEGATCETAMTTALGISLQELEQLWLDESKPQAPINEFFRQNLFWLVIVVVFGIVTLLLTSNPVTRKRKI